LLISILQPLSRFRGHAGVVITLSLSLMVVFFARSYSFAATSYTHKNIATTQLSTDPYSNSNAEHKTEAEPDIFAFGSTIVATFQVARFTNSGASNIGWATSNDSGTTWTNGFLPGITKIVDPSNPYDSVSDPAVTYDAKHNVWLISSLAITINNGHPHFIAIIVSRSIDDGHTWSKPVTVKTAQGNLDKDWVVCDNTSTSPFYGNCYNQWDQTAQLSIQLSTSVDGGLTWGNSLSTGNSASGTGGQPLVQPDGTVIVPIDNAKLNGILSFTSRNGGTSWSSTVTVATITAHKVAGKLRDTALISAAIDNSGTVYVVWQDCRFEINCNANDFVMSTSSDGINWSPVQLIPADPVGSGVDHFLPGLAIDPHTSGSTAHLVLAFYYYPKANCIFSTCKLEIGYISSTDGGMTWTPTTNIAGPMSLSWLAYTNTGWMVGDYIATAFSSGMAFPILEIASVPGGGKKCGNLGVICHESTFTVASGLR
jgi:hypothetical protein